MKNILITYHTVSGSTKRAAEIIYQTLKESTDYIDLLHIDDIKTVENYDLVIIGSPMRFGGFIKKARKFIKDHEELLSTKMLVYYQTCLYVIRSDEGLIPKIPIHIDPSFKMEIKSVKKMNFFDKTHRLSGYINLLLKMSEYVQPVEFAFFNGTLDLKKLGPVTTIFMKVITLFTQKEQVGDYLNPQTVKSWALKLKQYL